MDQLVFLDPLAALLIWVRQSWAIVVGCLIMGSIVLVNGYTAFVTGYEEFYFSLGLAIRLRGLCLFPGMAPLAPSQAAFG